MCSYTTVIIYLLNNFSVRIKIAHISAFKIPHTHTTNNNKIKCIKNQTLISFLSSLTVPPFHPYALPPHNDPDNECIKLQALLSNHSKFKLFHLHNDCFRISVVLVVVVVQYMLWQIIIIVTAR